MQRRDFLKGATFVAALPFIPKGVTATLTSAANPELLSKLSRQPHAKLIQDDVFWRHVRSFYQLPDGIVQLENGNWGVMSSPVLEQYQQHTARVNQLSSYYSRREFYNELKPIIERLAKLLGCAPDELALARGASEVLNSLISGYRHLQPGDAVMYADVDYDSMQAAMRQRELNTVVINLPDQASADDYVEVYRRALTVNPQVKLLLLTHLSHRHGLVLPIKAIVAMAREFGVDCIVDAAHSWGQMDFNLADLGADFVGFNLHKWMGGPIGCGLVYIKRERLEAIKPALGNGFHFDAATAIGSTHHRVHTGTFNYAAWLSIPAALDFHELIGGELKAARLRYLRDYWVNRARDLPSISIVADNPAGAYAAITALRLKPHKDSTNYQALAKHLLDEYGVFSVHRNGLAAGGCLRITPAIFTLEEELDQLVIALSSL